MEVFCVDKDVLGSESHLRVSSDGFSTVQRVPPDVWTLSTSPRSFGGPCLFSLLKLGRVPIDLTPGKKWTTMVDVVGCPQPVPWSKIMPASQYKSFVKNILKTVVGNFDKLPKDYCRDTWMNCGSILSQLRPVKIDALTYKHLVETDGPGNGALETFKPAGGGFANSVVYDRFGTRTGRLTVSEGPNILVLKKEHRKIMKSYFPNGKVVSLDFSALEARIILAEAGTDPGPTDVYQRISDDLFRGKFDRSLVKLAVLSELYGASKTSLGHRLNMSSSDLDMFVDVVKKYFKTADLKKRLKEELQKNGHILNKHGRPLYIDDPHQDHLLVNTYTQSTGVDVSLLGFKNIIDQLGSDGIRPLFVLHDALILDVREDRLNDVEGISFTKVPGYSCKFPLKFEMI